MSTDPSPAEAIVIVPGDRFFLQLVALDPAVAAAGQVEIALEEASPFPLAQVYHGFIASADGHHALGYAAYRRRFTAEELAEWPAAGAVVPDFLGLCGPAPSGPELVIQRHPGGLNGVAWDGETGLPLVVIAQTHDEPVEDQVAELVVELRRRSGLADALVRLVEGPLGVGREEDGSAVFRVGGTKTLRLAPAVVAHADVRDKSFLEEKQREDRQRRGWWWAFRGVALLGLLAAVVELSAGLLGAWNQHRVARVAAQAGEVQRIETAQTVATRIEDLTARQERPLEWLAVASAARPRSVQFLRVASQNNRTLEIEVQTAVAADVSAYEAALRRLPAIEHLETRDLRTREGVTTFVVALKFKPAAPVVAEGGRP